MCVVKMQIDKIFEKLKDIESLLSQVGNNMFMELLVRENNTEAFEIETRVDDLWQEAIELLALMQS